MSIFSRSRILLCSMFVCALSLIICAPAFAIMGTMIHQFDKKDISLRDDGIYIKNSLLKLYVGNHVTYNARDGYHYVVRYGGCLRRPSPDDIHLHARFHKGKIYVSRKAVQFADDGIYISRKVGRYDTPKVKALWHNEKGYYFLSSEVISLLK